MTGVQTCALPIFETTRAEEAVATLRGRDLSGQDPEEAGDQIDQTGQTDLQDLGEVTAKARGLSLPEAEIRIRRTLKGEVQAEAQSLALTPKVHGDHSNPKPKLQSSGLAVRGAYLPHPLCQGIMGQPLRCAAVISLPRRRLQGVRSGTAVISLPRNLPLQLQW